jgi:hypothetical protein
MKLRNVSILVAAAALAGCASTPTPTARYVSSESAIRAAQELQAHAIPAGQLHLKHAQDQLSQAKRLMAEGENKRAEYLLLRAESDADVAAALAKEAHVRKRANDALEELRKARSAAPAPVEETPPPNMQVPPVPDPIVPPAGAR